MPNDDPILKRLASEVGSRASAGLKAAASTTRSVAGNLARNAPSKAAATAAAVGAVAAAGVGGGKSVAVKGFDFLRPKASPPFMFFALVAAYQIYELLINYKLPLEIRAFVYFIVFLVMAFGIRIGYRQAAFLSLISLMTPYVWERLPKTAEFAPVNIIMLLLATSWAWWIGLTSSFSGLAELFRWALIIILAFGIVWPQFSLVSESFGFSQYVPNLDPRQGAKAFEQGLKKSLDTVAKIPVAISKGFQNQIKRATGDFYTGEVDKNTKKPLGVMIEKLEPSDPAYFEGEKVTVWATLKAVTLDEPISIIPKCWSDKGKMRDETQGFILPPQIEVDSYENDIFNCRFELLKSGSRRIRTAATFNFNTKAYQKTYFMDKDKIRSLRREQIDPLDFYKITDKKPVAVFTNGPVMIGMSVPEPPVGLKQGDFAQPFIGVTLSNNWQGRIESLTELRIELPKGFEIDASNPDSCSHSFKFAETDNDGYNVYELDMEKERSSDPEAFTNIEKFQSFRCLLKVRDEQIGEILGGTPISVKYFRASVKYVYSVEKELTLEIKKKETTGGSGSGAGAGDTGAVGEGGTETTPEKPISGNDAVATIKYWAGKYGVPQELALKVAMAEGGLQHYGSDGKTVKRGDGGCSFGVMQINTCAHKQCIGKVIYDTNSGDMCRGALSCAGTDVKDINCNIEAGLRHLRNGYINWETVNSGACSCNGRYSGWDYALRYYNGCSCGNNYVENVKNVDVSQYLV